jgi:hypothetical protein
METIVHNVRDLKSNERSAAEQLVGHSIRENQQIIIQVIEIELGSTPSGAVASDGKLPDWCNVYEGLTDDEIDRIEKSIVRSHESRSFR